MVWDDSKDLLETDILFKDLDVSQTLGRAQEGSLGTAESNKENMKVTQACYIREEP